MEAFSCGFAGENRPLDVVFELDVAAALVAPDCPPKEKPAAVGVVEGAEVFAKLNGVVEDVDAGGWDGRLEDCIWVAGWKRPGLPSVLPSACLLRLLKSPAAGGWLSLFPKRLLPPLLDVSNTFEGGPVVAVVLDGALLENCGRVLERDCFS